MNLRRKSVAVFIEMAKINTKYKCQPTIEEADL